MLFKETKLVFKEQPPEAQEAPKKKEAKLTPAQEKALKAYFDQWLKDYIGKKKESDKSGFGIGEMMSADLRKIIEGYIKINLLELSLLDMPEIKLTSELLANFPMLGDPEKTGYPENIDMLVSHKVKINLGKQAPEQIARFVLGMTSYDYCTKLMANKGDIEKTNKEFYADEKYEKIFKEKVETPKKMLK